jgi:GNAT superfamily N-acetyltransferase
MLDVQDSFEVALLTSNMTAEIAAVISLLEAQLDDHGLPRPKGPDGVANTVRGMLERPERGFIYIARDRSRTVGVAYLSRTWTLERGGDSVWLEELYILPELRSRGLGQRLLLAAIDHARQLGCAGMELEVEQSHARAANLYRRLGFVELPRRRYTRVI